MKMLATISHSAEGIAVTIGAERTSYSTAVYLAEAHARLLLRAKEMETQLAAVKEALDKATNGPELREDQATLITRLNSFLMDIPF